MDSAAVLVRPGDRFEHWHQVTCRNYSLTEARGVPDRHFRARVAVRSFGPLMLSELWSATTADAPIRVARGAPEIRRDQRDDFLLWLALGGSAVFAQDGRAARMQAGDLVLHDQSRPFVLEFGAQAHVVMVTIPRPLLTARLAGTDALVARSIARRTRLGALAGAMVRQSLRLPAALDDASAQRLGAAALDIWATALQSELAGTDDCAAQPRLEAVKRDMRAQLDNPELNLDTLAARHAMSPRTLARLFAREGTTPIRWLWQQRLAASYRALAEGRERRVTEVAMAFGFSSLSHFSRAFRAAYGCSPQALRDGARKKTP